MPSGPYGLGFGLGEAGAAIGQGVVNSQIMAPQIRGLNLRNQEMQTEMTNRELQNKALSTTAPEVGEGASPYDQPLANLSAQYKSLMASGQGLAATKLQQDIVNLGQKQRMYNMGTGIQNMFVGDYDKAKEAMNKAGLHTDKIERDADGNFNIWSSGNPEPVKMDSKHLQAILANPDMMSNILGQQAQQEYFLDRLGLKQQGQKELQEQKGKQAMERLQQSLAVKGNIADKNNAVKLQISNNTQAGLTSRQNKALQERTPLEKLVYAHQVSAGEDPVDAYATTLQMKANAKDNLPTFVGGIQRSVLANGGKWTPELEADVTAEYQRLKALAPSTSNALVPKKKATAQKPNTPTAQTPTQTANPQTEVM